MYQTPKRKSKVVFSKLLLTDPSEHAVQLWVNFINHFKVIKVNIQPQQTDFHKENKHQKRPTFIREHLQKVDSNTCQRLKFRGNCDNPDGSLRQKLMKRLHAEEMS